MKKLIAVLVVFLWAPVPVSGAMLEPGAAFPEWSLVDHQGAPFQSKDLSGTTYLLWFYPKADTPG